MPLKKPQSYFTEQETLNQKIQQEEVDRQEELLRNKRLSSPSSFLGELADTGHIFSNRSTKKSIRETAEEIIEKVESIEETPENLDILEKILVRKFSLRLM